MMLRKGDYMTSIFEQGFEHSEKLFEVSIDEFADKGYDKASINTILKLAGMSKGQFYYHFKNKEALYFALIDNLIMKKQIFLGSHMNPEDFNKDIFTIFETQIRLGMRFGKEYPIIFKFSECFIREKGKPIYKKAMAKYNFENNDQIIQLIDRAYNRGEFREELPREFIIKTVGFMFNKIPEMATVDDVTDYEEYLMHLIDFMRKGLGRT